MQWMDTDFGVQKRTKFLYQEMLNLMKHNLCEKRKLNKMRVKKLNIYTWNDEQLINEQTNENEGSELELKEHQQENVDQLVWSKKKF